MSRPNPDGSARRARSWWIAAIALAGLGAVCLGVGGYDSSTRTAQPPPLPAASRLPDRAPVPAKSVRPDPTPTSATSVTSDPSSKPASSIPSAAPPVSLRIPAINVATSLIRLGLNDDDTVEVPSDPDRAGWYELGPPPGQRGSAVILGHVDSTHGPAVFYRLRFLEPGDRMDVRLSNGAVAHFEVTSVVTYPNEDFPARKVYVGDPRRSTIALVTCGGDYDARAGGYQSNVVAYATLV